MSCEGYRKDGRSRLQIHVQRKPLCEGTVVYVIEGEYPILVSLPIHLGFLTRGKESRVAKPMIDTVLIFLRTLLHIDGSRLPAMTLTDTMYLIPLAFRLQYLVREGFHGLDVHSNNMCLFRIWFGVACTLSLSISLNKSLSS